jgi:hypothetical protein
VGKIYEDVHTQVKAKPERWVSNTRLFIWKKLRSDFFLLINNSRRMTINHLNL